MAVTDIDTNIDIYIHIGIYIHINIDINIDIQISNNVTSINIYQCWHKIIYLIEVEQESFPDRGPLSDCPFQVDRRGILKVYV